MRSHEGQTVVSVGCRQFLLFMADGEGFDPPERWRAFRFSRPVP